MTSNQQVASAVAGMDVRDLFKRPSQGEYANRTVFTPPIRQESAMLRAIESVRQGTGEGPTVGPTRPASGGNENF